MNHDVFLICFWSVVVSTFTTSVCHIAYIANMRKGSEAVWRDLDKPGPLYFVNGSWLGFGKYARYLLKLSAIRNASDKKTLLIGALNTFSFYILIIAWLVGVASWVLS
jgi:hypothetical protein